MLTVTASRPGYQTRYDSNAFTVGDANYDAGTITLAEYEPKSGTITAKRFSHTGYEGQGHPVRFRCTDWILYR